MYNTRVEYALNNFFQNNYFLNMSNSYELSEDSPSGKSKLNIFVNGINLCLADFDNKKKCEFLRDDKKYGMRRSSDHLLFQLKNNSWILHIIEMKTTVGNETWKDIKLKTRTTYLTALAISSFLGIDISEVCVYTTYEYEKFYSVQPAVSPYISKPHLGKPIEDYKKKEWDKNLINITIDKIISFPHQSIQMVRNENTNILEGILFI